MKQFINDQLFRDKVNKFCDTLFQDRQFPMPKVLLTELCLGDLHEKYFKGKTVTSAKALQYIQTIINHYDEILRAGNVEMKDFIRNFNAIISEEEITPEFHEAIVKAMRYVNLREKEYLKFLKDLNIRNCVYCHAQFIITIDIKIYEKDEGSHREGDVKSIKGLLELDHKYPTSKYPFLCTTFYNLYPACSHCNKAKSSSPLDFDFYTDQSSPDLFRFKLKDYDVIKKHLGKMTLDEIEIEVEVIDSSSNKKEKENFLELFKIKQIYNTQKDIIEELLKKKEIYTAEYIETLKKDFGHLFTDPNMINRMILGNYDKPEDVWKRPLAKFMQDIARDIKLID